MNLWYSARAFAHMGMRGRARMGVRDGPACMGLRVCACVHGLRVWGMHVWEFTYGRARMGVRVWAPIVGVRYNWVYDVYSGHAEY